MVKQGVRFLDSFFWERRTETWYMQLISEVNLLFELNLSYRPISISSPDVLIIPTYWHNILSQLTPWKINMEPENDGLEDDFPLQLGAF